MIAFRVRYPSQLDPLSRKALSVLCGFLQRQLGHQIERLPFANGGYTLAVGDITGIDIEAARKKIAHDGYAVLPGEEGLALVALNGKGLLNAAYGLLAECGVLWPAPGIELLPQRGMINFPTSPIFRTPAFPRRGINHTEPDAGWESWCEWYARLGFNEIQLTPEKDTDWAEMRKTARRFGMALQVGGHGLSRLLPRKMFAEHPDYFRALQPPDFDRTRMPDSNVCSGHPGAQKTLRDNATLTARKHPGVTAYHLWADDLPAGGWCYCSRCMGFTPQDQAVRASNAVAEGIVKANPKAKLAHLIYHDTIEAPRFIKPHPALTPVYAPRERCYAHAINDPSCARNRFYYERLKDVLRAFDNPKWLLFEYYSDYLLFRGILPLMPELVAADLRAYHALGLDCASHLQVGKPVGLQLNLHVFAQQVWNLDADPWEPLRKLAKGVPGLLEAWEKCAAASKRWTAICDWPNDRYTDYRFLMELPKKLAEDYRAGVRTAAEELDQAVAALPAKLPKWAQVERLSLETSAATCRQMEAHMALLQAVGESVSGEGNHWREAKDAYKSVLRLGKVIARLFVRAKKEGDGSWANSPYFFAFERMIEQILAEKVDVTPERTRKQLVKV